MSKYAKLQIQEQAPERQRGPGRPRGKASNPDYTPTTILLRKDLKKKVQMRAIDEGFDLSDVTGALLEAWLNEKVKI